MHLVFDDIKRQTNLAKHGFDLADVTMEFFLDASVMPSRAGRYMATNIFRDDLVLTVVFSTLGVEAISVISMRPASRKERIRYAEIA